MAGGNAALQRGTLTGATSAAKTSFAPNRETLATSKMGGRMRNQQTNSMSNYEITGTIIKIGETQSFGQSGFTKREFVIEEQDGKYPQQIKMDAVKDGCDRLDAYKPGDTATIGFNIRGNEHNGKHYVSLQAWKFDRGITERPPARQTSQNGAAPPSKAVAATDKDDDIPF